MHDELEDGYNGKRTIRDEVCKERYVKLAFTCVLASAECQTVRMRGGLNASASTNPRRLGLENDWDGEVGTGCWVDYCWGFWAMVIREPDCGQGMVFVELVEYVTIWLNGNPDFCLLVQ